MYRENSIQKHHIHQVKSKHLNTLSSCQFLHASLTENNPFLFYSENEHMSNYAVACSINQHVISGKLSIKTKSILDDCTD